MELKAQTMFYCHGSIDVQCNPATHTVVYNWLEHMCMTRADKPDHKLYSMYTIQIGRQAYNSPLWACLQLATNTINKQNNLG